MNPAEKQKIGFLLLGGIAFLGFYWQYKLFTKDKKQFKEVKQYKSINKAPARIKFGFWLCIILILGIIVNGLIAIHVDHKALTYSQIWKEVRTTIWFSIVFLLKSFVGPILTMGSAAIAGYYYLNYAYSFVTSLYDTAADS